MIKENLMIKEIDGQIYNLSKLVTEICTRRKLNVSEAQKNRY